MSKIFSGKLARCVAICLIVFLFVSIGLLGSAYFMLLRNPEKLLASQLRDLSESTGLQFGVASIQVSLLPLPSVALGDLSVRGSGLEFRSPWVSLRPNFLLLLSGKFAPAKITALRPGLRLRTDLPLSSPEALIDRFRVMFSGGGENKLGVLSGGCELDIEGAQLEVGGAGASRVAIADFSSQLELSDANAAGVIKFSSLEFNNGESDLIRIEDFHTRVNTQLDSFFYGSNHLNLSASLEIAGVLRRSLLKIDYESGESGWLAHIDAKGDLALQRAPQPWSISGTCVNFRDNDSIAVRKLEWSLGADSGNLDATFSRDMKSGDFNVQGIFFARRLSLTQWFGFARNLAPGLQLSLDNVREARLAFNLNKTGLNVPLIRATCSGARFSGSGSVADFSRPVVYLDLSSDMANLGLALGESLGKSPLAPTFSHPPLTPMPGEPLKPGETGIGYDIRLGAEKLLYGPLTIKNAHLRISPGKIDKDGLEEVLLDARADFYGGEFNGQCILGAPANLPITITAACSNINGAQIAPHMPALPIRKGKFQLNVKAASQGKELKPFLANLKGQVSLAGNNVGLKSIENEIFSKLNVSANLRSASLDKNQVGFDGKWQIQWNMKKFTGSGSLDGKIWFGSRGAVFNNLPARLSATISEKMAFLRSGQKMDVSGTLSGQSGDEKFSLAQMRANLGSIPLEGNIHFTGASFGGSLKTPRLGLDSVLKEFGISGISLPANMRDARLSTDFSGNADHINLSRINASLGESQATGSLAYIDRATPFFKFSLDINKFDLERTLGQGGRASGKKSLDFPFMREFDAAGDLRIGTLAAWQTVTRNLKISIQLNDGKLTAAPITGTFYGAQLNSRSSVLFKNGLQISFHSDIKGFDLGDCSKSMITSGVLTGRASINLDASARLSDSAQFPSAMNGSWSVQIDNAKWQSKNRNGELKGKPTTFSSIQGAGKIEKGIVRSSSITMRGPGLSVTGKGSLNLDNKKLDCKLDVSMKGLPDFPLTVSGTMDKPKTSIGAGKLVINAIGEIAGGIGDAIGGVANTVWKIFR